MNNSVLLVEDNRDDAALLQLALHHVGVHNPVVVVETEQATQSYLAQATAETNLPVLLVIGLRLEPLEDFPLLRWVRSQPQLCSMPVFVLSGVGMSDEERAAHKLGSDCYSTKPGTFKGLVEIAELLRDRWIAARS